MESSATDGLIVQDVAEMVAGLAKVEEVVNVKMLGNERNDLDRELKKKAHDGSAPEWRFQ